MAVRVEPNATIAFGTMGAAVDVTHVRVQKAGTDPIVRPLASTLSVPNGSALQIPTTSFDVVYPQNQVGNDHMEAVVNAYWSGEEMQIDCMTNSTTPVSTSGYSQQTNDAWTITTEAD